MTELTQEQLQELLHYDHDTGIFTNLKSRGAVKIGSVAAGYKNPNGYIYIAIDYKRYLAHRLAWLYVHGNFPVNQIDHINEVKDDNRIVNLRLATDLENKHNQSSPRTNNTSGYLGVGWYKPYGKWQALIQVNGRRKHLGCFDTAEEASEAYLTAKRKLHQFWVEEKTI